VAEEDRERVPRREGKKLFRAGEQMVIHALAEGVLMGDLIQFSRCDYMAVMHFPEKIRRSPQAQPLPIPATHYRPEEKSILQRLDADEEIPFSDVFPVVFSVALENLGRPYDFTSILPFLPACRARSWSISAPSALAPSLTLRPSKGGCYSSGKP
jgi:hypothetical protein